MYSNIICYRKEKKKEGFVGRRPVKREEKLSLLMSYFISLSLIHSSSFVVRPLDPGGLVQKVHFVVEVSQRHMFSRGRYAK